MDNQKKGECEVNYDTWLNSEVSYEEFNNRSRERDEEEEIRREEEADRKLQEIRERESRHGR